LLMCPCCLQKWSVHDADRSAVLAKYAVHDVALALGACEEMMP